MSLYTSIGTPTANSYVAVGSANTYFNSNYYSSPWVDIASATNGTAAYTLRENLLKQATREVDKSFRFYGSKYYQGLVGDTEYQNLEFPRSDNTDVDGNLYIPDEVKNATYEQALWILQRGGYKTTNEGVQIRPQLIGDMAYQYIRKYITRQAKAVGAYPWVS